MRRIGYGLIFLLMFCVLFTSCATVKPVDLNQRIKSGQLVQQTDNFIVLFDKSASMGLSKKTEMRIDPLSEKVGESNRLVLAKDTTKNMTAMIPEIKMNAGLRTFWAGETALIYGMKPLVKRDYTKAINSIEHENGRTPMGKAITAAGNDL